MSSPTFVSPPEETETRMAQAEVEESRDGNETSSHGAVEPDVISDTFAQSAATTTITSADLVDSPPPSSEPLPSEAGSLSPSASPQVSALPSPLSPLKMPGLADLTLHSPSSHIIGTPFATNTTRFEYPFPETSSAGTSSSSPDHSPSFTSSFIGGGMGTNGVYPGMASVSGLTSISPASSSSVQTVSGLYPSSPELLPMYTFSSPTHPKMRTRTEPPIPPSLAKKRNKWSLNLLLRRKSSSQGSSSTGGGEDSGAVSPGGAAGVQPTSPSRLIAELEGPGAAQGRGKQ